MHIWTGWDCKALGTTEVFLPFLPLSLSFFLSLPIIQFTDKGGKRERMEEGGRQPGRKGSG